jgi:hypothetical protein
MATETLILSEITVGIGTMIAIGTGIVIAETGITIAGMTAGGVGFKVMIKVNSTATFRAGSNTGRTMIAIRS